MADELDALWQDEPSQPAVATPVPPQGSAPPVEAPSPSATDALAREVYQLRGLVGGLLQNRGNAFPASPSPPVDAFAWKDKSFLGEDEKQLLLNGKIEEFPERLNRVLNQAAKSVHDGLAQEIQKRDLALAQAHYEAQQGIQRIHQTQAQEDLRQQFYEGHPDLEGDELVVTQATAQVFQEYQQMPWAYGSPQALFQRIAQVARDQKQGYLSRWGGGAGMPSGEPAGVQSPARRAAVETGGSSRIGIPAAPKGQQKAIGDMLDAMQKRR